VTTSPSRTSDAGTLQRISLPLILGRASVAVQPALEAAVARLAPALQPAVDHHLASGGKGVRPALVLLGAAACGAPESTGIPGAVAIELVHNFSLLHDDVIDGDTHRRHRPTVWAEFGIGVAIIAGDALATLSIQVLLDEPTPPRVAAAELVARATQLMIEGQADDMAFETRTNVTMEEAMAMAAAKTGALLSCAAALGPVLAGAPRHEVDALSEFGRHLGIAFQAVDDVLGIWGDPRRTGKPIGTDLLRNKKTLPVVAALERSDELVALLGRPLSEEDSILAAKLIESCGARDDVVHLANTEFDAALSALDRAALAAQPKAELIEVARFVMERDR
jgi:geranylgeranyl diphosphate synthase type I